MSPPLGQYFFHFFADITPFRIKDAQPVKLFSLNSALGEGVLNEKRFNNSQKSEENVSIMGVLNVQRCK